MKEFSSAALFLSLSITPALASELNGYCYDLGEDGCTSRYLPFENMAVDFCEETCVLTNPVSIRGLDGTLYDFKCASDSPIDSGGRVLVIQQKQSDGQVTKFIISNDGITPLVRCPAQ